jgi:hypothetical protein
VLTAGCSVLGRAAFQDPVVNLKGVELRGVGLTGGTLDVRLLDQHPPPPAIGVVLPCLELRPG